jgi:sec-independent protein translocase protein TatC
MFLTLGLYYFEYQKLKSVTLGFLITWLCSVIFLKTFIVPFSWSFFLSFQTTDNYLQPASFFFEARIFEYFNYFTSLYYICIINCQLLALSILFLNEISEKAKAIKTFRKLFYLIFVIFSTIVTPPDVISQVVMSLSLILIYELLIFARYVKKSIRQPIKTDKNTNCKH